MRKPDWIDRYILADLVDANGNVHWEDIANVPSSVDLFPMLTEEEKQQNRWYAEGYGDATKEINEKTEEAYAHGWTDAEAEYRKRMPTVVCHCKDCRYRYSDECPMYFEEDITWDDDGYLERDIVPIDNTKDDDFCSLAERWEE